MSPPPGPVAGAARRGASRTRQPDGGGRGTGATMAGRSNGGVLPSRDAVPYIRPTTTAPTSTPTASTGTAAGGRATRSIVPFGAARRHHDDIVGTRLGGMTAPNQKPPIRPP